MLIRIIFAMMLVANEMNKSIHSCGQVQAIPFDVNQKLYLTVNQNHITNYYPPGSQPLETYTSTESISTSTSRVQLQTEVDDGSSKAFHHSNNVQGLPAGLQPMMAWPPTMRA